ncbi:unnamed protein product [Kluyveromyces dobzhanskii CBS 2104]|uniref:WGS project CCBQ000000000 data, contig 00016 n=1 Tax=Kluyveromyces dobzhanskii CBS 2104 TaxID=1427455 RepID=A0A0A8L235_9SACH|nr:unnamed protein product [Kluyveromyces dobzhanskii CBS 2104]
MDEHTLETGRSSVCHCGCVEERDSIFERSVQDPFCSTFYGEDQDDQDRPSNRNDSFAELDPLREESLYYKLSSEEEEDEGKGEGEEAVEVDLGNNPFRPNVSHMGAASVRAGSAAPKNSCVCPNCHGLRKPRSKSSASNNGFSLSADSNSLSRTNSIVLSLSKQPTRQSIASSMAYSDTNNLSFGSPDHDNEEPTVIDGKMPNGSRSSISLSTNAIPTHVYSLERYVCSELDSATESFFDKSKQLCDETPTQEPLHTVSSSMTKLSLENSPRSSNSTLSSPTMARNRTLSETQSSTGPASQYSSTDPPPFLDARKRRKSFIELALSESFS